MNRTRFYRTLVILGTIWLSACSSWQQSPQPLDSLIANRQLEHWQLRGKVGLRNGKKGHSAYLNWRQCDQFFDIRLTGPLGQGAAHLYGDNSQTKLETSDKQVYTAASPAQLLQQHFGWSLPISQLSYWLRGIPAPDRQHRALDQSLGFEQDQWQLHYPRLQAVDGYQLPAKAIAEQAPIGQAPIKVTLIINNWQLTPNCDGEQ